MDCNATRKRRIEYLRWRLGDDPECALQAMLLMARRHTPYRDGRGFGHSDEMLLSFAGQVANKGSTLSPRQTRIMLRKMPKYAGQLLPAISEERLLRAMLWHGWVGGATGPSCGGEGRTTHAVMRTTTDRAMDARKEGQWA